MIFATPLAFWLLLPLVLLAIWILTRRRRAPLRYSSLALVRLAGRSVRQRLLWLPLALRLLAMLLLIVALARPQQGLEKVNEISQGIAIEMVVDRSSSMSAEMNLDGRKADRLQVVKTLFAEFVNGNGRELGGRPHDLVGMVSFARYADTVCPLTLAHGALDSFLEQLQLVEEKSEDGTAIGDALLLAAARLKKAEETLARQVESKRNYTIKSKIIILLTDGQNNAGRVSPEEAAAQAAEWGIKLYTVGVGNEGERLPGFFGFTVPRSLPVDEKLLTALAEQTGGRFGMATDAASLRKLYQEIDQLEKSEVEQVRYLDYREHFMQYALWALACLLLETLLAATWLRRLT